VFKPDIFDGSHFTSTFCPMNWATTAWGLITLDILPDKSGNYNHGMPNKLGNYIHGFGHRCMPDKSGNYSHAP
jgi:hypothetical protein